jgi:hypothetical protein
MSKRQPLDAGELGFYWNDITSSTKRSKRYVVPLLLTLDTVKIGIRDKEGNKDCAIPVADHIAYYLEEHAAGVLTKT